VTAIEQRSGLTEESQIVAGTEDFDGPSALWAFRDRDVPDVPDVPETLAG
jgi:hypothetical protein